MAQMTIYEIKLYNEKTRRYHFLAMLTAETPEQAKDLFIKRNNYKDRSGFRLFVKSPGCL